MKYEDIYERYLNNEIDSILRNLREAFVEYYGEDNRNKIEKIFNNLVIIYFVKNYSEKQINNKINSLSNNYTEFLKQLLKNKPMLKENDIVEYLFNNKNFISNKLKDFENKLLDLSYFKLLKQKKINDSTLNIIIGMNKGSISKNLEIMISDYVSYFTAGFSIPKTNHHNLIGLRFNKRGKIRLHTLVHEINHQLQKEELFKIVDDNGKESIFLVDGITNNHDDIINELVNEYCSKEIMDIFNRNFTSNLLELSFNSGYLYIDQISGNIMKKTYNLLKKEIKLRLINGNIKTIQYIIDGDDKENYSLLNSFYNKIRSNMYKASETGIKFDEYLEKLPDEKKNGYVQFANGIYSSIKNNYNKFEEYNLNLNNQVNKMIEEGTAKKIK